MVAYDKDKLEQIALDAIKSNELVFIDDLRAYLPCSMSTFYSHELEKQESIKRALYEQKINKKVGLRAKWYQSDNAALQMGLYKLISDKNEYNRLSNNLIEDDNLEVKTIPNRTTLATEATPQYLNVVLAIEFYKILILRGGTRSSKSYTLAQIACDWLITGAIGKIATEDDFSIVMESIPALKNTVVKDIEGILDQRGIKYKHHKTEKYFELNGRRITYFSSDSLSKMKRKSGFIWVDEADTMEYSFFQQLISRSSIGRIFLAFNPSNPDIWINQKLEIERQQIKKDVKVFVSSYLTNPFLRKEQIEEIEYLMTIDPEYKQVYGKGEYGNISGLMYPIWEVFRDLPQDELNYFEGIGQDYGYTDPHAIVRVLFDKERRSIYVYEVMYESQKEFDDIQAALMPYQQTAGAIITDNSQPATTSSLQNIFPQMEPTEKWQGSVLDGIRIVKKYKVYVHESAKNIIRENKSYFHAKNKQTGLTLEQPEDKNNHALDALRYIVMWFENIYGYEYDI